MVKNAPSARRREIAGAVDARPPAELSAALSVSGRTPSAMMMMTGTSIQIQEVELVGDASGRGSFTQSANRSAILHKLFASEGPPEPDRLVRHQRCHSRTFAAPVMPH